MTTIRDLCRLLATALHVLGVERHTYAKAVVQDIEKQRRKVEDK